MDLFDIAVASKLAGGGGGGGGSSYTLLHEEDIQVTYSSTSATAAVQIPLSAEDVYTNDHIVYVRIRDKAGKRDDYWYGSDNYAFPKGHSYYDYFYYLNSSGVFSASSAKDPGSYGNGLYLREIKPSGYVRIDKKYSSGTIDGTYHIEVYALDWPDGVSPFNQTAREVGGII